MIRSRNPEVVIERAATEEEVQEIEVREGRKVRRPHYVSDSIGRVVGLDALYPEDDLRDLLVIDLQTHMDEFRELSIPSLTHAELRRRLPQARGRKVVASDSARFAGTVCGASSL
jgi:hypothetical protein